MQGLVAAAAVLLVLALALQREGGFACVQMNLPGAPESEVDLGNAMLCGANQPYALQSHKLEDGASSISLGVFGRTAYLRITPEDAGSERPFRASIGAYRRDASGRVVLLFTLDKAFDPPVAPSLFRRGRQSDETSSCLKRISINTAR